ncbi:LemA family protein [Gulosibacter molinativorax]|uniref:LemA family protein n=1 Tax=Gulosibacter molinativorax TaxID=256821 RepID=A0ABT7C7V3_9MICO|nr:LemA family protein [Gulosibacter molinativorax]MDJ1370812.1 LemA family protein [Gulosibacter molinativorax]QUY62148.1 Protein LemA [Gulosibacter molinativorax]
MDQLGWIIPVGIVVVLLIALLVWVWITYNKLTKFNVRVDEAWSDITVQLKRRADLIPNIVETVKSYAKHESKVFDDVTQARSETLSAQSPSEASTAENHVQGALRSLFAVAEAYPQLQASSNFSQLQSDLVQTENKIQASRRYYNGSVRQLNTSVKSFPNNLVAGPLGFHNREFFEVADRAAISEPPRVQF